MTPAMHSTQQEGLAARERFLRRIGTDTPFYRLFDLLPEVAFFAKDSHFRLMCASSRCQRRCMPREITPAPRA